MSQSKRLGKKIILPLCSGSINTCISNVSSVKLRYVDDVGVIRTLSEES